MKIKYNKFAFIPVMCSECKEYIWLERYRETKTFWRGRYGIPITHRILCKKCAEKAGE